VLCVLCYFESRDFLTWQEAHVEVGVRP
jgi:hypothetical protein